MASSKTLDLLEKVRSGDELAKEEVVKDNLGLVWSIVHRFKNSYYDKEDLFQIGCIGLMKAINHFDPSYNVQFSTYAVPIIMGEIKRYFRDDGTIKVSRSLKELNIKVTKAKELLQSQNNEEPTVEEVAKYLDVDVQDVVEAIDSSYYPTSLNEPIYEKDGSTISVEDRLIDKSDHMWFEKIALEMEMEKLDDKEKMIIYMRYQLDYNQETIAKRLGISQVQVSRLEKKIVTKLRTRLKDGE
ncbi:SigB/SigF/SigG family RNA polymerase sigma factor [Candidatus Stoquefichus massiliensis]|uniref:SigB/SigF/SigG family RNA polymerase sigma factor n=1 Tax=Candidatus Stoquefichus massiliensis TaxID=1470350 RepID=UPI0004877ACA|nr:SigB/SigF/SigG family RNA polymerase sigma factor [Candidatus Stoquefichus massiliensis]